MNRRYEQGLSMIKQFFKIGLVQKGAKEGEYLFYPWRYPGEALILSQPIKRNILFLYRCLFWICILFVSLASFMQAAGVIISAGELTCMYAVAISLYHLLFLALVSSYRRKTQLHTIAKENRPSKILLLSWFFPYVQVSALWIIATDGDLKDPLTLLFFVMLSLCTMLTLYIFYLTIRTRGYLFETRAL